MANDTEGRGGHAPGRNVTRGALLLGAAGLLLYIIGAKRRHRLDAERAVEAEAARGTGAAG